jgi:DNA-binding NtrC family response regulator
VPVNVRIIAATNRNLPLMAEQGTFRSDLLFRLQVGMYIPPLREHTEDIPLFAELFLKQYGAALGQVGVSLSPDAVSWLTGRPWKGNVRELQNKVRSALMFCKGTRMEVSDLVAGSEMADPSAEPELPNVSAGPKIPFQQEVRVDERSLILQTLEKTHWNYTAAALELGMSRRNLYYKIEKYGID